MTKKCKTCGKPLPANSKLDFCSKECMEKYRETNIAVADEDLEIKSILLDSHFMRGLSWRQAKLEAIHKARLKGYSEKWIILQLIRGGLTKLTAKKLMDDSREAYGNGEKTE